MLVREGRALFARPSASAASRNGFLWLFLWPAKKELGLGKAQPIGFSWLWKPLVALWRLACLPVSCGLLWPPVASCGLSGRFCGL